MFIILFIMLYKVVLTLSLWMKFFGVTIQMKGTGALLSWGAAYYDVQNSFNLLMYGRNTSGVTIQIKATEQYFAAVLFIILFKIIWTFAGTDEILWCDYSNESYLAVLLFGTVRMFTLEASRSSSSFWARGEWYVLLIFCRRLFYCALHLTLFRLCHYFNEIVLS